MPLDTIVCNRFYALVCMTVYEKHESTGGGLWFTIERYDTSSTEFWHCDPALLCNVHEGTPAARLLSADALDNWRHGPLTKGITSLLYVMCEHQPASATSVRLPSPQVLPLPGTLQS
ncbi:MAG TPA: hypothetical protein V6C97_05165 [Oculatellaceae cyanobacterium]